MEEIPHPKINRCHEKMWPARPICHAAVSFGQIALERSAQSLGSVLGLLLHFTSESSKCVPLMVPPLELVPCKNERAKKVRGKRTLPCTTLKGADWSMAWLGFHPGDTSRGDRPRTFMDIRHCM